MGTNYTPLDTSRLESLHAKSGAAHAKKNPLSLSNAFLGLGVAAFVVSLSFNLQANKNLSSNSRASALPTGVVEQRKSAIPAVAVDATLEKKVLDAEAAKLNIKVTDAEALKSANTKETLNANRIQQLKYDLIKQKLIPEVVDSRTVYFIGFWLPTDSYLSQYPEKDIIQQQRTDARAALSEIETMLKDKKTPTAIAKTVLTKYPSLKTAFGINGFKIDDASKAAQFEDPITYQKGMVDIEKNELYRQMFLMGENDIKIVNTYDTFDGSGNVVQVVKTGKGTAKTYQEWVTAKSLEYK